MEFKCGIVGLPNVGKSTLFNLLTEANVKVANFPFCTIEANSGKTLVPDPRLYQLAEIVKPRRVLPTTIKFVDIAGLVKGASKGAGLGNRFLMNIREAKAIIHVVRCFEDDNVIHVTNKINPVEDIDIINTELILSDLNICELAILRLSKKIKDRDNEETKKNKSELAVLKKCLQYLKNARMLYSTELTNEEKKLISYLNFLSLKPTIYVANISEDNLKNNLYLDQLVAIADKNNSTVIPICAIMKFNFDKLSREKNDKFIVKNSKKEFNVNRIIYAGYNLLNLQTYFTVGIKEVRAWTIPIGSTALQAAGKIHSDFKKGFIRAQVISFEDFIAYKGKHGAKMAGKMRIEGKEYSVKDGDVLEFLFNV